MLALGLQWLCVADNSIKYCLQFRQRSAREMHEIIHQQKSSLESAQKIKTPEHGPIYFSTVQALQDFDNETKSLEPRSYSIEEFKKRSDILWNNNEKSLALHLLRQAVQRNPNDNDLIMFLVMRLQDAQKYTECVQVLKAVAKKAPTFLNFAHLGHIQYKLGDDLEALNAYEKALENVKQEDAQIFEVYKNLGNIYVKQREFDLAEEYYNKAYTMNPASDVLLVNIGTLQVQQQDYEKAVYCFRKAVSINAQNDKAWVGLAIAHHEVGDLDLAMANLRNSLEINCGNRTAVHIFSAWSEKTGKRSEAITHLQNYLATVDEDEEMSLVLINLYCLLGQFEYAKIECRRVLLWNPLALPVKQLLKKLHEGASAA